MNQYKFLTAILFVKNEHKALKYRNIKNSQRSLEAFEKFAYNKKADYINYYDKDTRAFVKRKYRSIQLGKFE